MDISDEKAVMKIVQRERPAILVNAAAYTDVDGCEDNGTYAFAVNGYGPGYIAAACLETGAILVSLQYRLYFRGNKT